ncbi:hypothetical protein ACTFIW_008050 [Dictyostelium discoideum]
MNENETSLDWKFFNNKENFLYITENYPQLAAIFKKNPEPDGGFDHFYIFLKHLKSNKHETKLNPILEIINEINKKQDKETLLKSNNEYNEIFEKLKYCLNKLDLIVYEINVDIDIDFKSMGIDVCILINHFASYELNLKYANGNFINDHNDFDRIKTAEIQATIATQSRPVWGKSYFRLAKVKPRLSNYQHAIQLYDVALHLESFI